MLSTLGFVLWSITQMDGQMKRCRPALEGQSNSYLMDPLALQGAFKIQISCYSTCKHTWNKRI